MPKDWKKQYSWVNIGSYKQDQEPLVDEINIVFYKLDLPFKKRLDDNQNWIIEVPWIYEEASKKVLEAYNNGNLDYPKDFGGLKPIEKKLLYHYESMRIPTRMLVLVIGFVFIMLAVVKWLFL